MSKKLRLLIIDDSESDALLLLRELRKTYTIEYRQVCTRDGVRAALAEPWDFVISDWSMPAGFNGLAAFEIVRELGIDVPFIIISGTIGEDIAVDALRAGVHDFMTKGKFARLVPSIERELREVEVRRHQRATDAELAGQRRDLERSERLLRDVLDSVPDAVVVTDRAGCLLTSNATAREQFGLAQAGDTMWSRKVVAYASDKLTPIPFAETALARALRGEAVDREEQFWPHLHPPEGAWMSVSARPLHDHGAIAVYRDMSRERSAQEQLMVSDRMASIGMLAAGVAHEINNPLAAVLANVDMAVTELDVTVPAAASGELREMLTDALQAAQRVRNIVRDLKIFSRHDEPEAGTVGIQPMLESTLRMAWNEIRHRARLEKQYGETPAVRGSESRLGQVFLNLIINAAQAIPEGNATGNTIRVTTSTDNNRNAVVEISDTGAGMSPEVQRHLFTPFFTTKPQGVGTGLGLAISHRIVTNLGGTISVESTVGRGTTFRVTLPGTPEVLARTRTTTRNPVLKKRGRILVIDDETLITAVIRRALAGHDVTVTSRAMTALDMLANGDHFDVILCDLMMPQMTGMELHEQLRKLGTGYAERMVFMTGDAFTEVARSFVGEVENVFLDKPFEPRILRALIDERLK